MPIQVLPATDADCARLFEVFSLAFFGNEPFVDAVYPHHWTPAGAANGAARFQKLKNTDPHAVYLKAIDTSLPPSSQDNIVGFAKWNVYTGTPPADEPFPAPGAEGDYWTPAGGEDLYGYVKAVLPLFVVRRNEAIARNDAKVLSLDICCVHPDHQRKGVGQALVAWGVEKADEAGVESVVESSVFGRGLYEKNGFEFLEDVTIRVPGWEETREPLRFGWLVRPKKVQ